jgi:hypothetical protein
MLPYDFCGIIAVGLAEAIPDRRTRSFGRGLSRLPGTGMESPTWPVGDDSSTSTGVVRGTSKDDLPPGVICPRRDMLDGLSICDQPELRYDEGTGDNCVMLARESLRMGVMDPSETTEE